MNVDKIEATSTEDIHVHARTFCNIHCTCTCLYAILLQYKATSRLRSSTVPTRPLSSTRAGKKKDEPEFMKEFKSKKKSTA